MQIDRTSVVFYIGAATTGEGEGKWSAPARDLPYLYERKAIVGGESSIYPDLETWKRFGLVVFDVKVGNDWQPWMYRVSTLADQAGDDWVKELLIKSRGVYLDHSKDRALDRIGCPQEVVPAAPIKPAEIEVPPVPRGTGYWR